MKIAVLFFLCALQTPAPAPAPAPAATPKPYEGTLAQGLQEVERLAEAGKKQEALELSERLLSLGRRAPVEYARGVVHAQAAEREPSADAFQHSRSDGVGELRLASIYNLGSLALAEGEDWFKKLPEISGKPPAHVPAQPPSAAPGQPPAGPDALAEARKSYLAAREHFVERLRAQWDDADTRANSELVQRRLKRLDEIEKQRKEEEQKKKQQQQSKDGKDPKDKQDNKDKQDPKDSDKQKDDPKDKPDEQQPPQDPKDQQPDKPKDPKQPDPQKPDNAQKDQQPPKPQDAQQKELSKEEMTRLLDKLQQLEDQAAKLRAQIHKARRVAVKKDW